MILKDPGEFPKPDPDDEEDENHRQSSLIIGSLVVDGIVQIFLTWWFVWILRAGFNFTTLNYYLWWAGCTLIYVTTHSQAPAASGKLLLRHIQLLLFGTFYVWLFK